MTKEEPKRETYALEEISKYRAMGLAPELFKEYDKTNDKSKLEETLITFYEKGLGVKNRRDIEDATSPLFTPQGKASLANFLDNFGGRYQEALFSQKIRDLRNLYDSAFKEYYKEENLPEVDKLFDSDETYESVMEKFNQAEEIVKSKTKRYSKEEKEKAKKTMETLFMRIINPLQSFENIELDKLRNPIDKRALKKDLNAPYEKKEEEKK